ncbi:MAG: PTS sugar transporter subunit IIA [Candidatus Krumholzibacteriota bacterium]|nr:PTS sugar transporter subunit IIA [Candidatus Krumholzibacteriota bacterium]
MNLVDYIKPENVKLDLEGSSKREVIEELVEHMAETDEESDADCILEAVLKREREGSTGLEKGIAIPHAKCDAVRKLSIVIGVSREGVDFESLDGKPAHLFFLMIAPLSESGPHVQAIAKIVKMIKLETFKNKLIKAKSGAEAIELIRRVENGEV